MPTRDPKKIRAYELVRNAKRRRDLIRLPCPCGNENSQAHHHDYTKPLDVEWLCVVCHNRLKHPVTPERVAKIIAAQPVYRHTKEAKERISEESRNRVRSEETRRKVSESVRQSWIARRQA